MKRYPLLLPMASCPCTLAKVPVKWCSTHVALFWLSQTHGGPLETIPSGDYTEDMSEMDHNSSPGAAEVIARHAST